jgi:DNA-directed RNA polymerase subunit RPC12/RpoP
MTRPVVRCRCGHRVLAKEVLRTDLYERPSGREYVYVKYRCKRCKRLGETFVAESRWDWRIFEPTRTEMSESETDAFAGQEPISAEEVLEFRRLLENVDAPEILLKGESGGDDQPSSTAQSTHEAPATPRKRDFKNELKGEPKGDSKAKPREAEAADDKSRNRPPRDS